MTPVYQEFLTNANRAFERAELLKEDKQAVASRKGDAHASDERFIESLILRLYQVNGVTAREANRMFPLTKFIT